MPARVGRLHFGRRFLLWHAIALCFRGPAWHPIVSLLVIGAVAGIVALVMRSARNG